MKFYRKKKTIVFLVFVILILGRLYYDNNTVGITRYEISSFKLPEEFHGYKILQLSDLHSKKFGKDNQRLLQLIDKEKPDIIVMTGDMVSSTDDSYDVFYTLVEKLTAKYPVYYIVGNHEQILHDYRINEFLENNGVTILDNEKLTLEKGQGKVNLYGLWFNLKYYKDNSNPYTKDIYYDLTTMAETLESPDSEEYNILLTHNPLYFPTYAQWGADLTLTGHVHGGLIIIPFKGGLLSPERDFFPEYYGGIYSLEESKMIVNRGLGNSFAFRFLNRPEISVVTLINNQ